MWKPLLLVLLLVAANEIAAQEEAAEAAPAEEAPAEEAAAAEGEEATATERAEAECAPCPKISIQHYDAKACTPVTDEAVNKCCPASYDCKTEDERNVPMTSCVYKNVTYEIGDTVPVDGPCRRGCICRASVDTTEPAKIECAIVQCPSQFSPPKPGCRPLYDIDECCEVAEECSDVIVPASEVVENENTTIREADCFSEGFEYYLGDKILFGATPCQFCICTKEFSGAFGPNCTRVNCGMNYRDRLFLRNGCTPLYLQGSCCNVDWICPGSAQVINDPEMVAKGDETPATHCTLGDVVAPRGTALKTYNCHVNCQCSTPPEFTCVQYPTCELALEAQKTGTAP